MNDMPIGTVAGDVALDVRLIPLELIDDHLDDMRRIAAASGTDAALAGSIRRRGVLEPIGVRAADERYEVVFGRRRLRCARAAGLLEIPASVRAWTDGELRAVQAAENLQREQPHEIDVWRTICDLVDGGLALADAAQEIGLDERTTRQMERLGRLHPDLLKLVEIDMPRDHDLRAIANAPAKLQQQAAKGAAKLVSTAWDDQSQEVDWHTIAARCRVERIARRAAIFDVTAMVWDEDLFAQPGDEDRFTTTDVAAFRKLQQAALEARVEQQRGEKRRVQLAEFDAAKHEVVLPKGFRLISTLPTPKPKKTECAFTALRPDGSVIEVLAVDVVAQKAADKASTERAKAKAKAAGPEAETLTTADSGPDTIDLDDAPPETEAKPSVTKAGLDLIAAAKTVALRTTLRSGIADLPLERLVALLVLALTADNIELRMDSGAGPSEDDDDDNTWQVRQDWRHLRDLARQLLLPGGAVAEISAADARCHAGEALARILGASGSARRTCRGDSGDAAEWIGAAINAADALPRFDTEAFLATMNGEAIRAVAKANGVKSSGKVADVRAALIGKLPAWRPDAVQFGAPPPARDQ